VHRLRIILEVATKGVQSGFRTASSAVKGFLGSLASMASSGRRFLDSLAQSVFFLGNAFSMLRGIAQGLFDRFIGGARDAAKLEVKLKHITGSADEAARVMAFLSDVAQQTGTDFEELARGAGLMAVAAKDASGAFDFDKFVRLSDMLQRMAALRPDVPLDRLARGLSTAITTGNWASLEMFLDVNLRQLIDIADAADDVADVPGEVGGAVTYIETKAGDAARDALKSIDLLDEALRKAGATATIVADIAEKSGMERFNETLDSIARTLGEPLFEAINEGAAELAGWLQDNPELIERLATALGNLGAAGIESVFEAITKMLASTDWETFFANATEFFDKLASGDIAGAFAAIDLGDLGIDIKDAAASLGDVAEALGVVAGWILKISGATEEDKARKVGVREVREVAKGRGARAEEQVAALGLPQWMSDVVGTLSTIQALTGPGLAQSVADVVVQKMAGQKVEVAISLDNDLLHAQVKQTSEGVVTDSFNELGGHLARGNR